MTQTVIGSPGVYDPRRNAMTLTGRLAGWSRPEVLTGLREAFGHDLVVENDVDAAALAERQHGHGREFASFAFVSIGTGIGMGLVIDGRLHRGVHGVAGEIAYLPISEGEGMDAGRPPARHARGGGLGVGDRPGGAARGHARPGLGPQRLHGRRGRGRAGRRGSR
ncbi:MAG: ROK family protein [Streptosporangiaceae bacterium]